MGRRRGEAQDAGNPSPALANEWTNETAWVQAWITRTFANGPPAGPALPMLLNDGCTRVINAATALGNGSLGIWRGAFTRNAG